MGHPSDATRKPRRDGALVTHYDYRNLQSPPEDQAAVQIRDAAIGDAITTRERVSRPFQGCGTGRDRSGAGARGSDPDVFRGTFHSRRG